MKKLLHNPLNGVFEMGLKSFLDFLRVTLDQCLRNEFMVF